MSKNNKNRYKAKGTRNRNKDDRDMAENMNELTVKSSSDESSESSDDNEEIVINFPVAMW